MKTKNLIHNFMFMLLVLLAFPTTSCNKEDKPIFIEDKPVTDIEGNVYNTIKINNQVWMAENLKTKTFNNGELIETTVPINKDISNESSPKYVWSYDGNEDYKTVYGLLYTWYAATDNRKVCPAGWHVPTDAEWTSLTEFLGGDSIAGGKLKESGTTHYLDPNIGATNESGFTAIPSGHRYVWGAFESLGDGPVWWSATEYNFDNAWFRSLGHSNKGVRRDYYQKKDGMAIRCIKD
jgi:uncharacterized protein (TIGR02145 family)